MSTSSNISEKEFNSRRELPRFPECPELTTSQIEDVTKIVFVSSNPQPADVLFVFGSSRDDRWEQVANLFKKGLAPMVYIAGGVGGRSFGTGRILSHLIREDLASYGIPMEAMIVDEKSANTLEDALFGKEIFKRMNIPHRRILFACKWPHGGRCLRTLKKVFPNSELFPFMYDFEYDGNLVTENIRQTWWHSPKGRSIVWGEYQRIKLYSERGDICE